MSVSDMPRTRNRRGQGSRLRLDILDAATRLLATDGPDGLSLRSIARAAGITAPSIYAHFEDLDAVKGALVANAFQHLDQHLSAVARDVEDPATRLRAMCRAYVRFGEEYPHEYAIMFRLKSDLVTDVEQPTIERMRGAEAFGIVVTALQECISVGAAKSSEPTTTAVAIWVGLDGLLNLRITAPTFPWPAVDVVVDTIVERVALLTPAQVGS
jgi:AcrR family transcriptional regulator